MDKKLLIIIPILLILVGGLIFAGVKISQNRNEYTETTTAGKNGDSKANNCSHMCHKNNFIWKFRKKICIKN